MRKSYLTIFEILLKNTIGSEERLSLILGSADEIFILNDESFRLNSSIQERNSISFHRERREEMSDHIKFDDGRPGPLKVIEIIFDYLIKYCLEDAHDISLQLEKINPESYFNLNQPLYESFTKSLFEKTLSENNEDDYGSKQFLLLSLVRIGYEKFGLEGMFKLLEGCLDEFARGSFEDDPRSHSRIILEAVEYCEQNTAYPIEWLLTQAFNRVSESEKLKH